MSNSDLSVVSVSANASASASASASAAGNGKSMGANQKNSLRKKHQLLMRTQLVYLCVHLVSLCRPVDAEKPKVIKTLATNWEPFFLVLSRSHSEFTVFSSHFYTKFLFREILFHHFVV